MGREERAAWRVAQKFHAEEKRADEIRMAEIAAEAEEKKRADEFKVQMAQIEVDRELKLKEMELQAQQAQAQVNTSSATTPPPRNSKKKPAQSKENDDPARRNVKVKEGATEEKCVAGPVVERAQAKKSDKVQC